MKRSYWIVVTCVFGLLVPSLVLAAKEKKQKPPAVKSSLKKQIDKVFSELLLKTNKRIAKLAPKEKSTKMSLLVEKMQDSANRRARFLKMNARNAYKKQKNTILKKGQRVKVKKPELPKKKAAILDFQASRQINFRPQFQGVAFSWSNWMKKKMGLSSKKTLEKLRDEKVAELDQHMKQVDKYIERARLRTLRGLALSSREGRAYIKREKEQTKSK